MDEGQGALTQLRAYLAQQDAEASPRLPPERELCETLGVSRDELLEGLAQQLPNIIHQLTPDGRLPNEQEVSRWL